MIRIEIPLLEIFSVILLSIVRDYLSLTIMSSATSSSVSDKRKLPHSLSESHADLNRSLGNIAEEKRPSRSNSHRPRRKNSGDNDTTSDQQTSTAIAPPRRPGSSRGLNRNKSDTGERLALSPEGNSRRKEKLRTPHSAPTRSRDKKVLSVSAHGALEKINNEAQKPQSPTKLKDGRPSPNGPRRIVSLDSSKSRQRRREHRSSDKSRVSGTSTSHTGGGKDRVSRTSAMLGLRGFHSENGNCQGDRSSLNGDGSKHRPGRRGLNHRSEESESSTGSGISDASEDKSTKGRAFSGTDSINHGEGNDSPRQSRERARRRDSVEDPLSPSRSGSKKRTTGGSRRRNHSALGSTTGSSSLTADASVARSIMTTATTATESSEETVPRKPASVRIKSKAAAPDDEKPNGESPIRRKRSVSKDPSRSRQRSSSQDPSRNRMRSSSQDPSRNRRMRSSSQDPSRNRQRSSSQDPSRNRRMRSSSQDPSRHRAENTKITTRPELQRHVKGQHSNEESTGGIGGLASFLKGGDSHANSNSKSASSRSVSSQSNGGKKKSIRKARKPSFQRGSSYNAQDGISPKPPKLREAHSDEVKTISVVEEALQQSLHIGDITRSPLGSKTNGIMSTTRIPNLQESGGVSPMGHKSTGNGFGKSVPAMTFAESMKAADIGGIVEKQKQAKRTASKQPIVKPTKEEGEDIFSFYSWTTSRQPREKILEQRKKYRDDGRKGSMLTAFKALVRDLDNEKVG